MGSLHVPGDPLLAEVMRKREHCHMIHINITFQVTVIHYLLPSNRTFNINIFLKIILTGYSLKTCHHYTITGIHKTWLLIALNMSQVQTYMKVIISMTDTSQIISMEITSVLTTHRLHTA